jgi:hypothetical protein
MAIVLSWNLQAGSSSQEQVNQSEIIGSVMREPTDSSSITHNVNERSKESFFSTLVLNRIRLYPFLFICPSQFISCHYYFSRVQPR